MGWLEALKDARPRPQINTTTVVKTLLVLFLGRIESFHGLELTRRSPWWKDFLGQRLPSADTLARVSKLIDPDAVRQGLRLLYARLKRNKALPPLAEGRLALVIDAHESHTSYRRCCSGCLSRQVGPPGKERTQFYHRYVAAALIGGKQVFFFLDIEPILSGEGEVTAAIRLYERIHLSFARAYDIVIADSLYAQAEFFRTVIAHPGKHVLTVLKQENRLLMVDAKALFETLEPTVLTSKRSVLEYWDVEDFESWESLGMPVRVVRTNERVEVRRQLDQTIDEELHHWVWVTTAPKEMLSSLGAIQFGHARWLIENKGFHEAVHEWNADHVFCHHAAAMVVLVLVAMIAINVSRIFYQRDLKPARRTTMTLRHLAKVIAAAIYRDDPAAAPP